MKEKAQFCQKASLTISSSSLALPRHTLVWLDSGSLSILSVLVQSTLTGGLSAMRAWWKMMRVRVNSLSPASPDGLPAAPSDFA